MFGAGRVLGVLRNALDFTLSIPLYVLLFVGHVVTRGATSRAIARRFMNPPGMRY